MLTFRFETSRIGPEIEALIGKTGDRAAAHRIIGLTLYDQTVDRFQREIAPDGTPWAPLSPLTLASRRNKRGILRDRGELFGSIHQVHTATRAEVGTRLNHPKVMVMQSGATIRPRRASVLAIPMGRGANRPAFRKKAVIPPRPYIGIGRGDEEAVKDALLAWLEA